MAASCSSTMYAPDHLAWVTGTYCQMALQTLIANPAANLTSTEMECCIPVVQCAALYSWNMEFMFTLGCGGGAGLMLLVVLFSSWLFIALHASKANSNRYAEGKLITLRFRQEFAFLHLIFFLGVCLSFIGIMAVMSLKVTACRRPDRGWVEEMICSGAPTHAPYGHIPHYT